MANRSIPIVDFSAYSLDRDVPDSDRFQTLIDEVYNAFSTIGFVYLVNTGIPTKTVQDAFSMSETFYHLPSSQKLLSAKPLNSDEMFGYVTVERDGPNPERPKDLKEGFNYVPASIDALKKAHKNGISTFLDSLESLFKKSELLFYRILEVMGRGLKFQDPMTLVKAHRLIGKPGNDTLLCSLFYPPTNDFPTKEGQLRCGEHSDFGTLTLLYQDSQGGLEVKYLNGDYIAATPIEGAIVVNIGDLMQRWTADKLISTKHRVMMPTNSEKSAKPRQSIAFFGHPDDDEQIACIDGSNKYEPIRCRDYIDNRFRAVFD